MSKCIGEREYFEAGDPNGPNYIKGSWCPDGIEGLQYAIYILIFLFLLYFAISLVKVLLEINWLSNRKE